MKKFKDIFMISIMSAFLLVVSLVCWFKPESDYSDSERRVLDSFPELSIETVLDGKFMTEFEEYTLDQFPMRDGFRTLKAASSLYLFNRLDNNDLYIKDGYIAKLEYPYNSDMTDYAATRFNYIYNTYLKDSNANVYLSIVPDKSYFLSQKSGHLAMDYDSLITSMRNNMPYAKYIDIMSDLTLEDYYKTDTHWKQENIVKIAEKLGSEMGFSVASDYKVNVLDAPFYGVYVGQSALPFEPEQIKYLTNSTIDSCIVTSYDTGVPVKKYMYDMNEAKGKDPYEMFTSGSDALLTVENPNCETGRELVIFRDSFTSSLAPLLVEDYSKITLVDIRYIQSQLVGNFVDFENCDALFLYSTLLLNNSIGMK